MFWGQLFYKSIRPVRDVGAPRVVDVKAYQYLPNATIQYKLKFSDEWTDIPGRKNKTINPMSFESFPALYKERLQVKKSKFDYLQALKLPLERDYNAFYDTIPFS